jgi:hypothetical protein
MVDQVQVLVAIVAIVVSALALVYRRELAAFPVAARARARSVPDLTSAKFRWGPHERRAHVKALTGANLVICLILIVWLGLDVLGTVLFIALWVWFCMFTILFAFNWVYDDFLWVSRSMKVWGLDPFPWNGNLRIWERSYGKRDTPSPLDDAPAGPQAPKKSVKYGIAFESAPDRWYTGPPRDGYIVVAPILPQAESVKSRLARTWTTAAAKGKPQPPEPEPGTERLEAIGTGWWDGYQYDVPGIGHAHLLGRAGLSDFIADPDLRRIIDGLDLELRAEIYAARPDAQWWSTVVFIEEPSDELKPTPKAPDSTLILANMDLRAEIRQLKRDADAIATFHRRAINRMSSR